MGLKLKNKGHANFYECCDLTKKVYLISPYYGGCCWKKSLLDRLSEFGDNLWPPESKTTANRMSSKKKPRYAIS